MGNEIEQPKHPAHVWLVQRLISRSKNNQVRFSERYHFDYMGAAEFEIGTIWRTVRRMHHSHETGTFEIDGVTLYAVWDPIHYNAAGVQEVLERLWYGTIRVKEPMGFSPAAYQSYKALQKQKQQLRSEYRTNAWFEIEGGLFWTWEKCNLKDFALNFAKSVEWMDLTDEQRRERNLAHLGKPTLAGKLSEALKR